MASMLDSYMQNYGARLQSLLQDPNDAVTAANQGAQTYPLGARPAPPMHWQPGAPVDESAPRSDLTPALPQTVAPSEGSAQTVTFRDEWENTPKQQRVQFVDELESALEQGNQTIDSAFDEMVRQLGTRPSGKLSREDKGMLLMEFGLSLMANSARNKYGNDLGGAIGAAGLQTLGRYQQLTRGRQQEYDQQLQGIESARVKAKSDLAKTMAQEGVKGAAAEAQARRRESELAGTIEAEQGIYGRTRGGKVSALTDPETGEKLKPRPRASSTEPLVAVLDDDGNEVYVPRSQAAGRRKRPPASQLEKPLSGLKPADSNTLYKQAAGLFGGTFDPMTGRISGLSREQTQLVQQIAALGGELFLAQPSASKNHAKAIKEAFAQIKAGDARPAISMPEFSSELEVGDALERGEISIGDVVVINGKKFKVQ